MSELSCLSCRVAIGAGDFMCSQEGCADPSIPCRICEVVLSGGRYEEHAALHDEENNISCHSRLKDGTVCGTKQDYFSRKCPNEMCRREFYTPPNTRGETFKMCMKLSSGKWATAYALEANPIHPPFECIVWSVNERGDGKARCKYASKQFFDDKFDNYVELDKIYPSLGQLTDSNERKRNAHVQFVPEHTNGAKEKKTKVALNGGSGKKKREVEVEDEDEEEENGGKDSRIVGKAKTKAKVMGRDDDTTTTSSMSGPSSSHGSSSAEPKTKEPKKAASKRKSVDENRNFANAKLSPDNKADYRRLRAKERVDYFDGKVTTLDREPLTGDMKTPGLLDLIVPPPPTSVPNSGKMIHRDMDLAMQTALFHEIYCWLRPALTDAEEQVHNPLVVPVGQKGITFVQVEELLQYCPTTARELELLQLCKSLLAQPASQHPRARKVLTATVTERPLQNRPVGGDAADAAAAVPVPIAGGDGVVMEGGGGHFAPPPVAAVGGGVEVDQDVDGQEFYYVPRSHLLPLPSPSEDDDMLSLGHQIVAVIRRFLEARARSPRIVQTGKENDEVALPDDAGMKVVEEDAKSEGGDEGDEEEEEEEEEEPYPIDQQYTWTKRHAVKVVAKARRAGSCLPFPYMVYDALLFLAFLEVSSGKGREAIEKHGPIRGGRRQKGGHTAFYGGMYPHYIEQLVQRSRITSAQTFYDVGCGIGQVAMQVSATTGARSVGVEIDSLRSDMGIEIMKTFDRILDKYGFPGLRLSALVSLRTADIRDLEPAVTARNGQVRDRPSLINETDVAFFNNYGSWFVDEKFDFNAWIAGVLCQWCGRDMQLFTLDNTPSQRFCKVVVYESVKFAASWNGSKRPEEDDEVGDNTPRRDHKPSIYSYHYTALTKCWTCDDCTLENPLHSEICGGVQGDGCGKAYRGKRTRKGK